MSAKAQFIGSKYHKGKKAKLKQNGRWYGTRTVCQEHKKKIIRCRHKARALNDSKRRCVRNYCIMGCLKMPMNDDSVYFQVNCCTPATCKENGNKTSFSKLCAKQISVRLELSSDVTVLEL